MPANALRREMLAEHILSLRSIAIVVGSSSQLSWELKKIYMIGVVVFRIPGIASHSPRQRDYIS